MKTLYLILACFMNSATMIAIGALILSFLSLIFTAKTYKKNRRLEFLQRKDHLSQKISELNDKVSQTHHISATLGLVVLEKTLLPLSGEQAEQNTAQIAFLNETRDRMEDVTKLWEEYIASLHLIYSNLNLETDSPKVEKMIAITQIGSDKLKNINDSYISTLHTLETTNELTKTILTERDEKIRQINIDFERAMEKLSNKKLD